MQPNLSICRAQEARQNAIAASAPLANAKAVVELAAKAWAKEAVAAQRREEKLARRVQERLGAAPAFDDRMFSENPDLGCAKPET